MTESSICSKKKIGPGVSAGKSFKGVDGRTDDRRGSDRKNSSWAEGSGELNNKISGPAAHPTIYSEQAYGKLIKEWNIWVW